MAKRKEEIGKENERYWQRERKKLIKRKILTKRKEESGKQKERE